MDQVDREGLCRQQDLVGLVSLCLPVGLVILVYLVHLVDLEFLVDREGLCRRSVQADLAHLVDQEFHDHLADQELRLILSHREDLVDREGLFRQ